MSKRAQTIITIDQPTKFSIEQLRNLINNSIFDGGVTITVTCIADDKKTIKIAGEGWSATATVPDDFELFAQPRYVARISNMDKP